MSERFRSSMEILSVGNLQAFVRYIWQVNDPLSQISSLSSQIQSAFAAIARVLEILEEEESAAVSREEAEKKILKEAGKGYEIERLGLEKVPGQHVLGSPRC